MSRKAYPGLRPLRVLRLSVAAVLLAAVVLVGPGGAAPAHAGGGVYRLKLWWMWQRGDNFTAATPADDQSAAPGYLLIRYEPWVYADPEAGTVPLQLYWHAGREDNASVADINSLDTVAATGYTYIRTQGWLYATPGPGRVPLYLYWHAGRQDFLTVATQASIDSAISAGYVLQRIEGYVMSNP
ncbi:hypothetical protein [Embleya sp. MST-111070]|uniref:hypothetical protein n=1 Tax=Embleya sp. MST-111070 TaxID=3398231 RepID=UPI003F73E2BC